MVRTFKFCFRYYLMFMLQMSNRIIRLLWHRCKLLGFTSVFQLSMIQWHHRNQWKKLRLWSHKQSTTISVKKTKDKRQDFYKLKETNARFKEELQKSRFSFSMVKVNAAHFLCLTRLTSVIFSWLMTKN